MTKNTVVFLMMAVLLSVVAPAGAEMKITGAEVKVTGGEVKYVNGEMKVTGGEIKLVDAAAKEQPAAKAGGTVKAATETTAKVTDAAVKNAEQVKTPVIVAAPSPAPAPAPAAPVAPAIKFSGLAQAQFVYDSALVNKELYATVKRVRMAVSGDLGNNFGLFAQAEMFTANINILDLVIDYNLGAWGKVGMGRFGIPFGLQNQMSPYNLLTVNPAQVVTKELYFGRDFGMRWVGKYKMLEWVAAGINGSDNSLYVANAAEDNNIKDIVGRVGFLPFRGFGIGASLYRGQSTAAKLARQRTGADIRYDRGPVFFQGEYIAALDNATDVAGYYAEAGYKFGKFQPVARYDVYDGDTSKEDATEMTIMAGGFNYYVNSAVKLSLLFEGKTDKAGPGLTDVYNDVWTFQTSVKF